MGKNAVPQVSKVSDDDERNSYVTVPPPAPTPAQSPGMYQRFSDALSSAGNKISNATDYVLHDPEFARNAIGTLGNASRGFDKFVTLGSNMRPTLTAGAALGSGITKLGNMFGLVDDKNVLSMDQIKKAYNSTEAEFNQVHPTMAKVAYAAGAAPVAVAGLSGVRGMLGNVTGAGKTAETLSPLRQVFQPTSMGGRAAILNGGPAPTSMGGLSAVLSAPGAGEVLGAANTGRLGKLTQSVVGSTPSGTMTRAVGAGLGTAGLSDYLSQSEAQRKVQNQEAQKLVDVAKGNMVREANIAARTQGPKLLSREQYFDKVMKTSGVTADLAKKWMELHDLRTSKKDMNTDFGNVISQIAAQNLQQKLMDAKKNKTAITTDDLLAYKELINKKEK